MKQQPTLVFSPGESHGQRNLVGYSPWGLYRVWHNWSHLLGIRPKIMMYLFRFIWWATINNKLCILTKLFNSNWFMSLDSHLWKNKMGEIKEPLIMTILQYFKDFSSFLSNAFYKRSFPGSSVNKESACSTGDPGSISGSDCVPGEGSGNPLQYSLLENPMDRGVCRAIVHGLTRVR